MKLTDEERRLVEDNIALVDFVMNRKCGYISMAEREDIRQIGMIGLCKAAANFDPSRGFAFTTFAARCIINEIFMTFRKQKSLAKIKTISFEDALNMDDEGNTLELSDVLCDVEDAESGMFYHLLREMLKTRFDERDRKIIEMTIRGMRQQDIADHFGVTQSIISRRLKNILKIIRKEHFGEVA